jgi:hypothetical protein
VGDFKSSLEEALKVSIGQLMKLKASGVFESF